MKQLTCEMCGSTDLMKQDGVFVCQSCGTKYSVEEAKKMMIEGTVTVNVSNERSFEKANGLFDQKKYDEAIERLSALIRENQKNYRLYIDLADCYLKNNQKEKAVECLKDFHKTGMKSQAISEMLSKIMSDKSLN